MLDLELRFVNISYWYPTFLNDHDTNEWGTSKLGIICRLNKQTIITKTEMRSILEFLYTDIYGDIAQNSAQFSEEVKEIFSEFDKKYPPNLQLI